MDPPLAALNAVTADCVWMCRRTFLSSPPGSLVGVPGLSQALRRAHAVKAL